MGFQKRVILLTTISVFLAISIGNIIIWNVARKSYMDDSYLADVGAASRVRDDLMLHVSEKREDQLDYYFVYKLDRNGDKYTVVFRRDEDKTTEVYNNIIFDPSVYYDLQYQEANYGVELSCADYVYNGERFRIVKFSHNNYDFFHVSSIEYVYERMKNLAYRLIIISIVLTIVANVWIFLRLRKMFKPLNELMKATNKMADGDYEQSVEVRNQDEIGKLSKSFNKMAEEIRIRNNNLIYEQEKKTLFMGNLTHELKTPMTAISGYAQTLLNVKLTDEQQEEAYMFIYDECNRLERLAKKMMVLLELDTNNELQIKQTKIKDIFESAKNICEIKAAEKNVKLIFECSDEAYMVDKDLMTDVIINLVDNAIKASEPNSDVVIKAENRTVSVQDFGCGIPKEEQDKIMEPFYMVDKSRSRKNGGAGLGLALVSLILKKHDIDISIESDLGKGTKISLHFV